jgi:hypothetical protein
VYSKYTAYFPPDAVERITDMWLNKDPSIMILIIGCLWGRLPDLQYTLLKKIRGNFSSYIYGIQKDPGVKACIRN